MSEVRQFVATQASDKATQLIKALKRNRGVLSKKMVSTLLKEREAEQRKLAGKRAKDMQRVARTRDVDPLYNNVPWASRTAIRR